ncbi:hypothetical protein F5141DRAFT_819460 [Pisolithus sp. B1]|nr:hypothetical protein F5141DRAFT_819460 [Pisolithus sp. B1]
MARYHDGVEVGWVHLPQSLHVLSAHIILHSHWVGKRQYLFLKERSCMPGPSKARAEMNAEPEAMDLTMPPGAGTEMYGVRLVRGPYVVWTPLRLEEYQIVGSSNRYPGSSCTTMLHTALHCESSRTAEKRTSCLCYSLGVRVRSGSLQSAESISRAIKCHPTSCRRCILRCSHGQQRPLRAYILVRPAQSVRLCDWFEPSEFGFQGDPNAAE